MADPYQLLRSVSETKGCRAAVITSYNASFRFFEHVVLPRLRGAGCKHILLLVDAARFAEAVTDPERRPQLAGKQYSLVPVAAAGAFHPKIVLQLGERSGRLWLGSHNLTLAGFNHNRELTTAANIRSDDHARGLLQSAWAAVRAWLPEHDLATEAADAVEGLAPWLTELQPPGQGGRPEVLYSTAGRAIWPELRSRLPASIRRITVLGPFFDNQLHFLKTVLEEAAPEEMFVGVIPEHTKFPSSRRSELPSHVKLVHAEVLLPQGEKPPYLHAKAILFESDDRRVLVSGSANPSAPAFLGGAFANCEAIVIQDLVGTADPLQLQRLSTAPALSEADWNQLPPSIEVEPAPASTPIYLGTREQGEIVLPRAVEGVSAVHFIGEANLPLGTLSHAGTPLHTIPAPSVLSIDEVRWLELYAEDTLLARVLVHHRRVLRSLSRTGAEQRLSDVLQSLETNRPDLTRLLALLDPLLDQPVQTKATMHRSTPSLRKALQFGQGGAEAMDQPEATTELYSTEGSLAEVMLYLHHRIGSAVSQVDNSEEDLVGTQDEALVEPAALLLDFEQREVVQHRFDRITKKLSKRFAQRPRLASMNQAPEHTALLAAALGVAHASVLCAQPQGHQKGDHYRLAKKEALKRLLRDGVAAMYFGRDLQNAEKQVGPNAEEIRITPVLLAWICCELRMAPPGPSRRGRRRSGAAHEQSLVDRALWLALIPSLDDNQWERLLDTVVSSDSSPAALAWFDAAHASAAHLRSVIAAPQAYLSTREGAESGDLALFGGRILRVVKKDIGGPRKMRRVQWLEPGNHTASKQFNNGHVLNPSAWAPSG